MGKNWSWDQEKLEYKRLSALYDEIPKNRRTVAEGLIRDAARLKVSIDDLWEDIQKNGFTEFDPKFGKDRERASATLFNTMEKSYRATLKHLDSLLPTEVEKKKRFSRLDDDDE